MNFKLIKATPDAGGNGSLTAEVAISSDRDKLVEFCLEEYKAPISELTNGILLGMPSWDDYFYIINTNLKIV